MTSTEHVLTPDDRCPCGEPQEGSGYCSYECFSKFEMGSTVEPASTVPASMGGPLSEAERTAEIRARLDAATPGPWHKDDGDFGCVTIGNYGWTTPPGVNGPEYDVDSPQGHADAELVAHAPDDLAYLLGELDDAQRLFDALGSEAAAELKAAHAALTNLREQVGVLEGQLAAARERLRELASKQDRIPDTDNGDWGIGWDDGYNAALAEVRHLAAEALPETVAERHRAQEVYLEFHEFPVQSSKRVICAECSGQPVPWDVDEASIVLWPCKDAVALGLDGGGSDAE